MIYDCMCFVFVLNTLNYKIYYKLFKLYFGFFFPFPCTRSLKRGEVARASLDLLEGQRVFWIENNIRKHLLDVFIMNLNLNILDLTIAF